MVSVLGIISNTTPSTGRGSQFFQFIKLITWQHLSVEKTDHHVELKASSCSRSLLPEQEERSMRCWSAEHGQSVPQKTVRNLS